MSRRPTDDRASKLSLSQIIFALDDRNLLPAIRMLEPAAEGAESPSSPDRHDGPRCVKCITHGE